MGYTRQQREVVTSHEFRVGGQCGDCGRTRSRELYAAGRTPADLERNAQEIDQLFEAVQDGQVPDSYQRRYGSA